MTDGCHSLRAWSHAHSARKELRDGPWEHDSPCHPGDDASPNVTPDSQWDTCYDRKKSLAVESSEDRETSLIEEASDAHNVVVFAAVVSCSYHGWH